MGTMQRRKGANFEREVANLFKEAGFNARRGGFAQAQDAHNEPDVILDDMPGLWIECKRGAKTYPIGALKQAKEAGGNGTIPLAVCKDDYDKITVTCEMSFFMVLLQSLIGQKEQPRDESQIQLEQGQLSIDFLEEPFGTSAKPA